MLYRLPCGGRGSVQWHASQVRSNGSTTPRDLASSPEREDLTSSCISARSAAVGSSLSPKETKWNSKSFKARKDRRQPTSPRLADLLELTKSPARRGAFCIPFYTNLILHRRHL